MVLCDQMRKKQMYSEGIQVLIIMTCETQSRNTELCCHTAMSCDSILQLGPLLDKNPAVAHRQEFISKSTRQAVTCEKKKRPWIRVREYPRYGDSNPGLMGESHIS